MTELHFGDIESEDDEPDTNHDEEVNNQNKSTKKEPVLAKYVRKNHNPENIIGSKSDGVKTRNKLKGTCLLLAIEPKIVNEAMEVED